MYIMLDSGGKIVNKTSVILDSLVQGSETPNKNIDLGTFVVRATNKL